MIRSLIQIYALTSEELRDLVFRRRALLSLILYLTIVVFFVGSLTYVDRIVRPMLAVFSSDIPDGNDWLSSLYQWGLGDEYQLLMLLLSKWPGSVVVMQLFTIAWYPTLVSLVSCDMVSIDLYRGTLRYIVSRTSRSVYYVSKLLAHFFLYVLLQFLTLLGFYLICSFRVDNFDSGVYLEALSRYFLVFLPFIWFVVASTAFISCLSQRPLNAIVRLHLLWIAFLSLLLIDKRFSPLNLPAMLGLVAPFNQAAYHSVLLFGAWALIFSVLGIWLIKTRRL